MDSLIVEGGSRLEGSLQVAGAKNAALPLLCATLLTADSITLDNVPDLNDVRTMLALLGHIGVAVNYRAPRTVVLNAQPVDCPEAPYELVKTMRASILVLGPLLARLGYAKVALPGGCAIGARPVDQHIKGLRAMGAQIEIIEGNIIAQATQLKGAHIVTDMVTVTGTANLMMAATLAAGETVLENAACEPEISDLAECLNKMGADIVGAGTATIRIVGQTKLNTTQHRIIPDRIEAGTLLAAAAITGGCIHLTDCSPTLLAATLDKFTTMGCALTLGDDSITLQSATDGLRATDIKTAPYPGFPTDMQAQFMALNSVAHGVARVQETIFENRFMHAVELARLGAQISIDGRTALVTGSQTLTGARVMATDLRASASLLLAGLAAEGTTRIDRIYHLDRGYERIEDKLSQVGGKLQRLSHLE